MKKCVVIITFVTLGLLGELGEVDVVFAGGGGISHCMNMCCVVGVKRERVRVEDIKKERKKRRGEVRREIKKNSEEEKKKKTVRGGMGMWVGVRVMFGCLAGWEGE